jgi:Protein of unknown function (DUF3187)
LSRAFALALLMALARDVGAADAPATSPLEWREHWLLARGRLALPAASSHALPEGHTTIGVDFDWGNDLGWDQPHPGESPESRSFLVDGEHRTLTVEIRRGVSHGLDLGLRVPLEWRGGGVLDGVIDWFHGFTKRLGLPDNGRSTFVRDLLRADLYHGGQRLAWDDRFGAGLGRLELSARWSIQDRGSDSAALIGRLALPTGTGPFAGGGTAAGLQVVGSRALGRATGTFGGLGATLGGERRVGDVEYTWLRPEGFLGLERRLGRRWSVLAQSNAAGRLITNIDHYSGIQWYLTLGGRLRLDSGWTVEGGFTENIASQQATTDFGVQLGVTRAFGSRR